MSNGLISSSAVSAPSIESPTQTYEEDGSSPTIHRSASSTQLKKATILKATPEKKGDIQRSFSENVLANTAGNVSRTKSKKQTQEGFSSARRSLKRLSSGKNGQSKQESGHQYTVSKFIVGADQSSRDVGSEPASHTDDGRKTDGELKSRSVSASLSNFARRSWSSASRSPSPSPSKRKSYGGLDSARGSNTDVSRSSQSSQKTTNGTTKAKDSSLLRRNSILNKKPKRPLSSLLSKSTDSGGNPSVPPIPKSFSTDKLPSLTHKSSTLSNSPALPDPKSIERLGGRVPDTPRKKDELWNVFRHLDGEYQKFQSRSSTLKTGVIRSALLPFLRSYAEHPSNLSLRPEDLDRRTVILNKWWTGLLEMLNGRHGESVSGNDRPAVLEAVTALMIRPEWTMPSLTTASRATKTPRASLKSRSTTSLGSTMTMSSDFLVESVCHNVRNIFTQNLLAQMAYVVDKMSMRSVAASVVAFCGKATAYAFFYCEGIAEILVRLWTTPASTLRRVLAEYGVEKGRKLDSNLDSISIAFPTCLHSLTYKSLPSMLRHLRSQPHLPIATTHIPWHSPWVTRWAGKDTDLFYVFTKFFTDLICRFLPDEPSIEEKVAAPGWLLVQAQILTVLDSTMQRLNNQPQIEQAGPSSITFDEVLGEADANATVLPLPMNGGIRSMAENRLILLLRDCLSGSTVMVEKTQSMFAHSFGVLLKATARRTSVFDHNACFILCDFLEEALAILTRYHQASDAAMTMIDWSFWLDVCKQMLQSHNSMTEVRLCAFLYAMWPTIAGDTVRKREICIDWLLTSKVFRTQFEHWCPMVRAFFMRLLAWRVARVDGKDSQLDKLIIDTLAERLQESWCQYFHVQETAKNALVAAASTPAPGRRLLIIRNDVQPPTAGMFLSFDDILSSSSKVNPYDKHSSTSLHSRTGRSHLANNVDSRDPASEGGKRRWNFLRSIIPNSSSSKDRSSSNHQQDDDDNSRNGSQGTLKGLNTSAEKNQAPSSTYRSLSFKFSLEWYDDYDSGNAERRLNPPMLPPFADKAPNPQQPDGLNNGSRKPEDTVAPSSKYAGRALAEWTLIILECKNFVERRLAEGVPMYQMVETPTLGVEPFRKS
ncbi:hypothetical protein ACLMJK_003144 [Lecanora helva]